jgi:hypothetical protein
VPRYDDQKLAASSLILANKMEHVPSKDIGGGRFILGDTLLWPRVTVNPAKPAVFHRNQRLNFWMQVYNLGLSKATKHNDAMISYQIEDATTHKMLLNTSEKSTVYGASVDQVTLEKSLPLASLEPGRYIVKISVNDDVTHQQIAESAPFTVEK